MHGLSWITLYKTSRRTAYIDPSTCGNCHTDEYSTYQSSVHGNALIQESNPDVPVCTTCHGVHNIQDPRTQQFRVNEPDLCASCHANQEMMGKYGLSADVYSLYSLSWHGVDVSVYQARWPTIQHQTAICSDCHGIHDILKPDDSQFISQSEQSPGHLPKVPPRCGPELDWCLDRTLQGQLAKNTVFILCRFVLLILHSTDLVGLWNICCASIYQVHC